MNTQKKDLSEKNETEKTSFECDICLEKRFVAFRPPCGHAICGVCILKILETKTLSDKCGMCRANLPEYCDEYAREFYNISDLKSKELEISAEAVTREKNLPLLKNLLAQNKFEVGERVRMVGLQNRKDLNGSKGVIIKLLVTSERHAVMLADGKRITIKPKNLRHSRIEARCVYIAVEIGHIEIFNYFAKNEVDLDLADDKGATVVYIAAQNGHLDIVKILAEQIVDLHQAADNGATPVLIAAQKGHIEIVKFLAEQKADLNREENNGVTPVYVAAQSSHIEIVKYLAEQKADLNRAKSNGVTPMIAAAYYGNAEIVKLLAESNADLDRADENGDNAIMIAAAQGHAKIVQILIETNANVDESMLSIAATDEIQEILSEALEKK